MRDKLSKLSFCLEHEIDYFMLLQKPKYDHRGRVWVVLTEGGHRHVFDEENEADRFYDENMPKELQ